MQGYRRNEAFVGADELLTFLLVSVDTGPYLEKHGHQHAMYPPMMVGSTMTSVLTLRPH